MHCPLRLPHLVCGLLLGLPAAVSAQGDDSLIGSLQADYKRAELNLNEALRTTDDAEACRLFRLSSDQFTSVASALKSAAFKVDLRTGAGAILLDLAKDARTNSNAAGAGAYRICPKEPDPPADTTPRRDVLGELSERYDINKDLWNAINASGTKDPAVFAGYLERVRGNREREPETLRRLAKAEADAKKQPPRQPVPGTRLAVMPAPGTTFRECTGCPEMVVLRPGSIDVGIIVAGSSAQGFRATIDRPLAIGVHEVTIDEWESCVADGGCGGFRPPLPAWARGTAARPVINISFAQAEAYAAWLSEKTGQAYDLPSEAEWYLANGGTRIPHAAANLSNVPGKQGADLYEFTSPVGSFPAVNGVYDLVGNVDEWLADCAHSGYAGAPADGLPWIAGGNCSASPLRGGNYMSHPWRTEWKDRVLLSRVAGAEWLGFRVVRRGNAGAAVVATSSASGADAASARQDVLNTFGITATLPRGFVAKGADGTITDDRTLTKCTVQALRQRDYDVGAWVPTSVRGLLHELRITPPRDGSGGRIDTTTERLDGAVAHTATIVGSEWEGKDLTVVLHVRASEGHPTLAAVCRTRSAEDARVVVRSLRWRGEPTGGIQSPPVPPALLEWNAPVRKAPVRRVLSPVEIGNTAPVGHTLGAIAKSGLSLEMPGPDWVLNVDGDQIEASAVSLAYPTFVQCTIKAGTDNWKESHTRTDKFFESPLAKQTGHAPIAALRPRAQVGAPRMMDGATVRMAGIDLSRVYAQRYAAGHPGLSVLCYLDDNIHFNRNDLLDFAANVRWADEPEALAPSFRR